MAWLGIGKYRHCFWGAILSLLAVSCSNPQKNMDLGTVAPRSNTPLIQNYERYPIADFEAPSIPVYKSLPEQAVAQAGVIGPSASSSPLAPVSRTSINPQQGLWALQTTFNHYDRGERLFVCPITPLDLRHYDTFSVQLRHSETVNQNGILQAALFVQDSTGHRFTGDYYPIINFWREIPLDLHRLQDSLFTGGQEIPDLAQITKLGIEIRSVQLGTPQELPPPITIATDSWYLTTDYHPYVNQRLGLANTFYVQQNGTRLQIGTVDRFEMVFQNRASAANCLPAAWLTVRQTASNQPVMGEPGTGLFMITQDQLESLHPIMTREAGHPEAQDAESWYATNPTIWNWKLLWSCPKAALVEVTESVGPYDRLGRGEFERIWHLMIYQTGQVYFSIQAGNSAAGHTPGSDPVALILNLRSERISQLPAAQNTPKLLQDIYPESIRQPYPAVGDNPSPQILPHEFQVGHPVAFAGKWKSHEDLWFHSTVTDEAHNSYTIAGQGIPAEYRAGPWHGILLVNNPQLLDQASGFSSYLAPPNLEIQHGQWEHQYVGDFDNDGLAESGGFMPIRMTSGKDQNLANTGAGSKERALWTVLPENRPIYYPSFLILPAATPDPKMVLNVNVDGQQFSNLPRWHDGGYLLQLPWIISNPVHIETEWVPASK